MNARKLPNKNGCIPLYPCRCVVCGNPFQPAEESPRLRVREFDFCLCSGPCAKRLLSQPNEYLSARELAVARSGTESSECPFGPGVCPLTTKNLRSGTTCESRDTVGGA